jgi:hypothetical protein
LARVYWSTAWSVTGEELLDLIEGGVIAAVEVTPTEDARAVFEFEQLVAAERDIVGIASVGPGESQALAVSHAAQAVLTGLLIGSHRRGLLSRGEAYWLACWKSSGARVWGSSTASYLL